MGKTTAQKVKLPAHDCPQTKPGEYQWPCDVCCPHYKAVQPGVAWYLLIIEGGVEIEQKGPFHTEFALDTAARRKAEVVDLEQTSLFWAKLKQGRLITGDFSADFFETR